MPKDMPVAVRAWLEFDRVVAEASVTSPWGKDLQERYEPDYPLLSSLLAVPLRLQAPTRSGLPAKAVDVWMAHELRRAGFAPDDVWPRPAEPRVLPREVALLRRHLPKPMADDLFKRLESDIRGGVVSADASILGKAYVKQVDVVMAQWARGPEILISTKRMDSSFGRNVFNRIEESYGDAKNLRGRHPLAALGFVFVMRSTAFDHERDAALRLLDLLAKLAQEDDAYDATAAVVAEWSDNADPFDATVEIRRDLVPAELRIDRFMGTIVDRVLARTPVDHHVEARRRRGQAVPADADTTDPSTPPSE